eukprot:756222-Hanusia_phi.AAC.4
MDRKDNLDLDIGLIPAREEEEVENLDTLPGMGPMENCWAAKGDSEKHAEFVALKEVRRKRGKGERDDETGQHLASGMREAFKGVKGKHFLVHGKMVGLARRRRRGEVICRCP